MKLFSSTNISWLFPLVFFIHQLEEYWGEFPEWYSQLLNVDLSLSEWLWINVIGLVLITIISLSYLVTKNAMVLVAMGALGVFNGTIHLVITLFTLQYSPGVVSGISLFFPLGYIVFKHNYWTLLPGERFVAIMIGVVILLIASLTAMNI